MSGPEQDHSQRLSRLRGMFVGFGYGDSVARAYRSHGTLANSAAGQLACFTAEASIGALLRQEHEQVECAGALWRGQVRWAAAQSIEAPSALHACVSAAQVWPGGWLSDVEVLRRRRGSPKPIVAAIKSAVSCYLHSSTGYDDYHAILPQLATVAIGKPYLNAAVFLAGMTHTPQTQEVVHAGLELLRVALHCDRSSEWVKASEVIFPVNANAHRQDLGHVKPESAEASVLGAVRLVRENPGREKIGETVMSSVALMGAAGTAPLVSAILGALYLPEGAWRTELGWFLDSLARDLHCAERAFETNELAALNSLRERYPRF